MTEVTQLFREVANGSLIGVQRALAYKPELLAARDPRSEQTPLHVAALLGHTDIIRELLARGFSHEIHDWQGNLPLHLAAAKGDTAAVRHLLSRGMEFSVRAKNREGQTPLHLAARGWHPEVARELLKAGARPETTDKEGRTALDLAGSHEELRQIFTALQSNFPSLLPSTDYRPPRDRQSASDSTKRSGTSSPSQTFTTPHAPSDAGVLSERTDNLSRGTRAKANAILVQARTKGSRVRTLRSESENLSRQESTSSGRSSAKSQGSGPPNLLGLHDKLLQLTESQQPRVDMDSLGSQQQVSQTESSQSGRLEEHEQRLGTAESNMRELRLAINRISDRLRAACLPQERHGQTGGESIDQAHGLLDDLSCRVASLETRLAQASPSAQSASMKHGFATPTGPFPSPDPKNLLKSLYAESPASNQEASFTRENGTLQSSLANGEISMEQHRILVEEQGILLRQVENRVEMIMKALEDRASEMLQGASLSGGTQASISEMLGNEMDRVQQALEHRFSRIETDIETLIQQEWKINAAADAAAERQMQARMSEQNRQSREVETRLMASQKESVEEALGRRGYEALMQQLHQGMSALGTRLAMLESAADRERGNASQASLYGDSGSERPFTGSSTDSQYLLNDVMRSDMIIQPAQSSPRSPQGHEPSWRRASRDRPPAGLLSTSYPYHPEQPPSRINHMDPPYRPHITDRRQSAAEAQHPDMQHPGMPHQHISAPLGRPPYMQDYLTEDSRSHNRRTRPSDPPQSRLYPGGSLDALPPGSTRHAGSSERGRHGSRGGSQHPRDRSHGRDAQHTRGAGQLLFSISSEDGLLPPAPDGQRVAGDLAPVSSQIGNLALDRRLRQEIVGSPARISPEIQPLPHHQESSARSERPDVYEPQGPAITFASIATQTGSASSDGRRPMDVLPEEETRPEARLAGPSGEATSSPGKRLRKRLAKPGNACKGCVIS